MGPSRHTASAIPALTTREALTAYATMINTGDPSALAPLLAPDFSCTSQNVLTDMVGEDAYLAFMAAKFETMRNAGLMPVGNDGRRRDASTIVVRFSWSSLGIGGVVSGCTPGRPAALFDALAQRFQERHGPLLQSVEHVPNLTL